MVQLQYALTEKDFVHYQLFLSWDAPHRKKIRMRYYLRLAGINLIVIALVGYTVYYRLPQKSFYLFGGLLLITTLLQFFWQRQRLANQAKKAAQHPLNAGFFLPVSLRMDEEGIYVTDELQETRLKWKAIVAQEEDAAYYYLHLSVAQALIIPKKILQKQEQTFSQLLLRHVPLHAEMPDWSSN